MSLLLFAGVVSFCVGKLTQDIKLIIKPRRGAREVFHCRVGLGWLPGH
jgi:hypothetical protein